MANFIDTKWARIDTEETYKKALKCVRGVYQECIIRGIEAMSGSTIKGKAAGYGARYAMSRESLLSRLHNVSDLYVHIDVEDHGRRVLVIESNTVKSC